MARDSFKTFIPLSVDTAAKADIIFDFFDLLSAVAAHGKANGFGGRKLARMAAWWAFEYQDTGNGFDAGYKTWLAAADATSHLFFAYLRSLTPHTTVGVTLLPRSLEKLLAETEYPPQRPTLMQSSTNRVVMIVDSVSPTPFALLRRANHFQYRDEDRALREWSEYDDPVKALTEECRRVLRAISAANQSQAVSSSKISTSLRDASWSRFEDIGFASALEEEDEDDETRTAATQRRQNGLRTTAASGNGRARPTTPSWADFLSSGFVDDGPNSTSNMLLPPDKVLPPIETQFRQRSSQSHRPRLENDRHLEPGELASITRFELDDSFWWVWMASLAPEETADRKSAFGRCAVVETIIRTGRWLVMEEMVKGAAPEPDPTAYIAEKKGFFSWTRRNKGVSRSKSTAKHALSKADPNVMKSPTVGASKTSIGGDQHAKIHAAAQQLQIRQMQENQANMRPERRGRTDADLMAEKTASILTLQPQIMSEASPAMKWASKYDKEAVREKYLGNNMAGRGDSTVTLPTHGVGYGSTTYTNGSTAAVNGYHGSTTALNGTNGQQGSPEVPAKSPSLQPQPSPAPTPAAEVPTPFSFQPSMDRLRQDELVEQSPEAEPTLTPLAEKQLEAPTELHPAARVSDGGRSTPVLPAKEPQSIELTREIMVSPEPEMSPESKKQQKKLHKDVKEKPAGSGGFRKLFGRKNRSSKVPEDAGSQLRSMGVRDDDQVAANVLPESLVPVTIIAEQPLPPPPVKPPYTRGETTYATPPEEVANPMPVTPQYATPPVPEPIYEAPSENETVSRVNTADAREASTEFARFDQGPLTDQPAFIDDDAETEADDATPPPIAREPSCSPVPEPRRSPQPPTQSRVSAEPVTPQSAAPPAAPMQDRWAQIRKNAAERAAQRQGTVTERPHKPYAAPSRPSDADDDTSGEESKWSTTHCSQQKHLTNFKTAIESRVARIKARVAELTGNMESHGGPGNATPPPIRR
jgi:hypothetical protein